MGAIPRCKVGEYVQVLGPETPAPGGRIVIEAKEDKSYDVKTVLEELQKARENRQAQVGIFVLSRQAAPENLEPLNRWGQDILVVWDALDPATDVYFKAALSLARFLVVKEKQTAKQTAANIQEMEQALNGLFRDITLLDDIAKMANTVKNHGENIGAKAGSLKKKIEGHLEVLREQVEGLAGENEK